MSEIITGDPSNAPKERHGCLTTYLVFMIIVNSCLSLLYLFGTEWLRQNSAGTPDWAFGCLAVGGVVNVLCAVALLRWKKWGFWGFVVSAVATFIINISVGFGPSSVLGGAIGIALLYGVLQIGEKNKGWPQLE